MTALEFSYNITQMSKSLKPFALKLTKDNDDAEDNQTFYYADDVSTDQTMEDHERILVEGEFIKPGEVVISTASMPIQERGRTNTLKLNIVKERS